MSDFSSIAGMGAGVAEGITGIMMAYGGAESVEKAQKEINKLWKQYPTYEIPTSIVAATDLARQYSQQGLPGEDLMAAKIQQQTAQGVSASREAATSAADLLGATTSLYGSQTQAMTDLQIQSARQKALNQQAYMQALQNKAQYEEQAFKYNEYIPWGIKMNEAQAMKQSGMDLVTEGWGTQTASYETFAGAASTYGQ